MGVNEASTKYQIESEAEPADLGVPAGFKRTEAGVIPEGWTALPLSEIAHVRSGGTPSTVNQSYWDGGIPWCTPTDITALDGSKYLSSTLRSISDAGLRSSSAELIPANSVVMTSRATIGACAINVLPVTTNQGFKNLVPLGNVDTHFLYYLMCTKTEDLIRLCAGSTFLEIGKAELARFNVQVAPLLEEQRGIAQALSSADALIESLQQLIAKKRALKQGVMQALLSGRQRLPGFDGEWSDVRLGDHLQFQVGFPFSSAHFNAQAQGVRLIRNRDLKSDDEVTYYSGNYSPSDLVRDGDVLVGMDGEFAPCLWTNGRGLLNQRVGRVVVSDGVSSAYVFHVLHEPLAEIERITSATTVKHLSHGDVENIRVALPSVEEQTAIATVLSDMDAEIDALEARLAKTRDLKAGMMQALLTGSIRLPLDEAA